MFKTQVEQRANLFFTITKTIFSVKEFLEKARDSCASKQKQEVTFTANMYNNIQFGMFLHLPFDVFLDRL